MFAKVIALSKQGTKKDIETIITNLKQFIESDKFIEAEELISQLEKSAINPIADAVWEVIRNKKEAQRKMSGSFWPRILEEKIQKTGNLLAQLDLRSDTPIIPRLHLQPNTPRDTLVKDLFDAVLDIERIAIIKQLFPLKNDKPVILERAGSYLSYNRSIGGEALRTENAYILSLDGFPLGNHELYGLLHEYLHFYVLDQGFDAKLDNQSSKAHLIFNELSNVVNDLWIEKLITQTFGETFSFHSVDLRSHNQNIFASSGYDNLQDSRFFFALLAGSISNEFNYIIAPSTKSFFDLFSRFEKAINQFLEKLNLDTITSEIDSERTPEKLYQQLVQQINEIEQKYALPNKALQEPLERYLQSLPVFKNRSDLRFNYQYNSVKTAIEEYNKFPINFDFKSTTLVSTLFAKGLEAELVARREAIPSLFKKILEGIEGYPNLAREVDLVTMAK